MKIRNFLILFIGLVLSCSMLASNTPNTILNPESSDVHFEITEEIIELKSVLRSLMQFPIIYQGNNYLKGTFPIGCKITKIKIVDCNGIVHSETDIDTSVQSNWFINTDILHDGEIYHIILCYYSRISYFGFFNKLNQARQ